MSKETVTLDSLVGEHVLTGVDFGSAISGPDSYCTGEEYGTCVFVLDGQPYTASEDPEDGYRSCMREIERGGEAVKNTFPACRVLGRMRTTFSDGGESEVLELLDLKTGKVVLAVGTENTDDYYPWYVARFDPTAMAVNT